MTLGRLLLAWGPVAAWFVLAAWARWAAIVHRRPEAGVGLPLPLTPWSLSWLLAEAGALTLFASLWFDSLGSGGWWLLFALVGFLTSFPARMRQVAWTGGALRRLMLADATADVARYVVGGAILAWRLG